MSLELVPSGLSATGDAVAVGPTGQRVYIKGALPGERVRVELLADRGRYATGRAVEFIEPSPNRIAPPCIEVQRGCGACQWQHIELSAQRGLKDNLIADAIRSVAGFDPPALSPAVELEPWGFRTSLRVAISDGGIGFRRSRSDDLVAIESCLVAHPLLAELLDASLYRGAKEVLLRCGARTGERLVSVTPRQVRARVPSDVQHVYLHEFAAGRSWRISARSFFQPRPDGVDALASIVSNAAAEMHGPGRAVDLYSGVGVFAGVLADQGWSVSAVEGSASSVNDARINLRDVGVGVVRCDVKSWRALPADLVVADPSRAGLGPVGVAAVVATGASRLVLISCDVQSLGRDAASLREAGFSLTSITQVDLFPHTFHVEVVSVFDIRQTPMGRLSV
jgi:23S rRNA (uracil1939-C5)-methyltransferase